MSNKKKIKISSEQIKQYLNAPVHDFPKYTTQILNLSNQNAQGTRPRVVGQLSELIQEFTGKTIKEWEKWYLDKYPNAIKDATDKVFSMVENLKEAINKIDRSMAKEWVKDLVIIKTFAGLRFQEALLKKGAELMGANYRLSEPLEESKGIDGFIGNIPISIKPYTYKSKKSLSEEIDVKIVYYKKIKTGIEVDYSELF